MPIYLYTYSYSYSICYIAHSPPLGSVFLECPACVSPVSRLYFTCIPPAACILGILYIPVSRISIIYLSILQQIHCHCIPLYSVSHCICWWTCVGCVVPQVVPGPVCRCPPAVLFGRLLSRL